MEVYFELHNITHGAGGFLFDALWPCRGVSRPHPASALRCLIAAWYYPRLSAATVTITNMLHRVLILRLGAETISLASDNWYGPVVAHDDSLHELAAAASSF
jgi:hypothetical protein